MPLVLFRGKLAVAGLLASAGKHVACLVVHCLIVFLVGWLLTCLALENRPVPFHGVRLRRVATLEATRGTVARPFHKASARK